MARASRNPVPAGRKRSWGKRKEAGVMNRLEADFAALLEARKREGAVLWYRYEPCSMRLTDDGSRTRYNPDFMVQFANGEIVCYEVKGYLDKSGDGWLKVKLAADQYPFRFILARRPRKAEPWTEEEI